MNHVSNVESGWVGSTSKMFDSKCVYASGDPKNECPMDIGDQPHNNMPPYYVLAYIMKVRDDNQIEEVEMA